MLKYINFESNKILIPKFNTLKLIIKNQIIYKPVSINSNDVALLQYTSGSTSIPKGVEITYENINIYLLVAESLFPLNFSESHIQWIPIFHDLALFTFLLSISKGQTSYIMKPETFLFNPIIFLKLINNLSNGWTAVPNFSLDYIVNFTKKFNFNSNVKFKFVLGGEQVLPQTVKRFEII